MKLRIDLSLFIGLLLLSLMGLIILYSAANQNMSMVFAQIIRFALAFFLMFMLAQIPPYKIKQFAPWFYAFGLILLLLVLGLGEVGKGAQRWLSLGFFRFQPSELMKLAVPLILAWYFSEHELPPKKRVLGVALILILIPAVLTAKQPDLGTALIIASAGVGVILLAGVRWTVILFALVVLGICAPFLLHHLHGYQRERLMIFLNPESDPLGAGYHIIQSKIAIGSGGIFGKGYLHGTQSHLQFLPEHTTDFIFAVCGEELGLMGGLVLISLYALLIIRGFIISYNAQDTFSRLLAGSISLTFFFSVFINLGMVTGILPVVGLPLPLVSYGGTSMLTLIAGFGLLMSIQTHRRLVGN
ncbi:MAG TPA: rod shape-determining protein RodA [Gammaproteobacteria bacterium]|nr:rod shape-determining protein RodA [Gammaproteobacteria bacterium]